MGNFHIMRLNSLVQKKDIRLKHSFKHIIYLF